MSETLEDVLAHLSDQLAALEDVRSSSRFAGQGADPSFVEHLAAGGSAKTISRPPTLGVSQATDKGVVSTMQKALAEATGPAGGYLVPVETAREVLRLLRARSAVMSMGVTTVPVKKQMDLVSLSAGAAASYVAENARIGVTEQTFATSTLLRPRNLAALVPVSRRLLDDADNPSVEEVIRRDLSEVLALRADLAFLRGTGSGEEPLGMRNVAGTTPGPDLGTNGRALAFDDLLDVVASLRNVNAPFSSPGWIFHPKILQSLSKLKDADGHYLADSGLLTYDARGASGTLLNLPWRSTTQIPANLTTGTSTNTTEVFFSSDWNECWIGENEEFEIAVSSEAAYSTDGSTWNSAFQQNQVLFRAMWAHDIGLRRPQLFTVVTGARV